MCLEISFRQFCMCHPSETTCHHNSVNVEFHDIRTDNEVFFPPPPHRSRLHDRDKIQLCSFVNERFVTSFVLQSPVPGRSEDLTTHLLISANFHDGEVLVNTPYENYKGGGNMVNKTSSLPQPANEHVSKVVRKNKDSHSHVQSVTQKAFSCPSKQSRHFPLDDKKKTKCSRSVALWEIESVFRCELETTDTNDIVHCILGSPIILVSLGWFSGWLFPLYVLLFRHIFFPLTVLDKQSAVVKPDKSFPMHDR